MVSYALLLFYVRTSYGLEISYIVAVTSVE